MADDGKTVIERVPVLIAKSYTCLFKDPVYLIRDPFSGFFSFFGQMFSRNAICVAYFCGANMKNFKYIFIAALGVLASCQVEEHEEKNDANVDVTFIARNEANVKTALNEEDKVLWDGGSVMSEARLGADRPVVEFTATVPAGKDYYAVYPYSDELSLTTAGIAVEVPHSQSGTFARVSKRIRYD